VRQQHANGPTNSGPASTRAFHQVLTQLVQPVNAQPTPVDRMSCTSLSLESIAAGHLSERSSDVKGLAAVFKPREGDRRDKEVIAAVTCTMVTTGSC
jgi:hypothetical protein